MVFNEDRFQELICLIDLGDLPQLHLRYEPVLEHPEESFNTALGLGAKGKDGANPQRGETPPYLGGFLLPSKLLIECPVIVIAV